ncbi:MAG TPA: phosphatase PAP2 family protein [Desulfomonilaceae bacterium]|nr:phosphatase PAP2 family protein [Desulfomonilaceae bacterium]
MSARESRFRGLTIISGIFIISVAATIVLDPFDLAWTGRFFTEGGQNAGWILGRQFPWAELYRYGEIPPLLFALCALLVLVASKAGKVNPAYARPCLVVILTVAIGPGVLVNGFLKEYWGRPRPADIQAFGGNSEYRKVWQPGGPGSGKSFTCGHCAMAFSVVSGAAFYRLHPGFAAGCAAIGLSYGLIMSIGRMAQGGHFPTDALWSASIVLMVLAWLYYLVLRIPDQ